MGKTNKTKASEPHKAPASSQNDDQHRRSQISAQVDADFRARLRPELRKLYDLYYKDNKPPSS